jgi:hypothetical protein
MTKLKARQEIFQAIRTNGPVQYAALPAYLSSSHTGVTIDLALAELVFLGRVTISKERQLTAR